MKLFLITIFFCLMTTLVHAQATCATGVLHCANLNWTWTEGTGGPATGFNVYRTTTSGGCATVTATGCAKEGSTSSTTLNYTDSPLAASTTYYWVVTAFNTTGESGPSNQVTGTTAADPVPAAPASVTVTAK